MFLLKEVGRWVFGISHLTNGLATALHNAGRNLRRVDLTKVSKTCRSGSAVWQQIWTYTMHMCCMCTGCGVGRRAQEYPFTLVYLNMHCICLYAAYTIRLLAICDQSNGLATALHGQYGLDKIIALEGRMYSLWDLRSMVLALGWACLKNNGNWMV